MAFLVNLHAPVEFTAGIAGPGRVHGLGEFGTSHEIPLGLALFDMLVEVSSIGVAKLEQGTIVADAMEAMGHAAGQMLIVLSGDPGLSGGRGLDSLLDAG